MKALLQKSVGAFSVHGWGRLPALIQLKISKALARLGSLKLSRYLIPLYCRFQYGDPHYYRHFKPGNGASDYGCFHDFFTRELKEPPPVSSSPIWPCEGLFCDSAKVGSDYLVNVKGERRHIRTIFGEGGQSIPDDYYFSNVFLHNNNYHHIHAPVSGKIARIEHIPGELLFLRPWAYRNNPSLPAFRNERVNIDIVADNTGQRWFLSMVGGPLVATIKLVEKLKLGAHFTCGERMAGFLMGSTCCIAAPLATDKELNHNVGVGDKY